MGISPTENGHTTLWDDAIPRAKSFSFQYRTWINRTTCNAYQRQNEGNKFNHASSTHRRSFRDVLDNEKTKYQNPREGNDAKHRRTGSFGVLTPDTETPEVPQTTVSPDFL